MTNKINKWQAVIQNDSSYDGEFYYAVKTTGVFCRPSCQSRVPLEANVEYFDTSSAAMDAGYRPCKRCRPDLLDYNPIREVAEQAKSAIDCFFNSRLQLAEELAKIGVSQHRMTEIFKEQYGATPNEYMFRLRIQAAKDLLSQNEMSITDIALSLDFESLSAFYGFFRKFTQMTPKEYRRAQIETTHASNVFLHQYDTALGCLTIAANDTALAAICFEDMPLPNGTNAENHLTSLAAKQIAEYAAGKRARFELPLAPSGTEFQKSVWQALRAIPYGETRSYKQVAQQIGNPAASRAVGMANNKNPIPIIIPCHRVVGTNGALVGYAGGLDFKKMLLELEARYAGNI